MAVSQILNVIYLGFAVLGAVDYVLDNRLGLGAEFERGIGCAGKLILCMTGFMALSPVIGERLTPLAQPLFAMVGADPSALAGLLLANDSGGAAVAAAMAVNPEAGLFHGYIVASMMGAAMMCLIPMSIMNSGGRIRPAVVYGLLIGLASAPFGCVAGGLCAGFPLSLILRNSIPAALLAAGLFLPLLFFSRRIIRPLCALGKLLAAVSLTGLLLSAANAMLGAEVLKGLTPFSEVISVIGGIALALSGAFPMLFVVSKLCGPLLRRCAAALGIERDDMDGLLIVSVNIFPVFDRLDTMSPKGAMLNCAFMIGANCMLGDHFAFTSQTRPGMTGAVLLGKAAAAAVALLAANLLTPRLLGRTPDEKT